MKQVPPTYSPDGAYWWDGTRWHPVSPDGLWQWDGTRWQPTPPPERSVRFRLRRALILHLILGIVIVGTIIVVDRRFSPPLLVALGTGWLIAAGLMITLGIYAPKPWPAIAQFLPAIWLLLACGAIVSQLLASLLAPSSLTWSTKTYTIPDAPDQVFGPWILSSEAPHLWRYEDGKLKGPVQLGVGPYTGSWMGDSVWVANGGSNTVSRIDSNSLHLRATIPVGHHPAALESVDTNRGDILVANRDDGSIARIDQKTNRVTATIPIGQGPVSMVSTGLCITCDDKSKLWVADEIDQTVVCLDLATNRVLTVLPVGGRPTKLALTEFPDPDRSTLEVLIPDRQSMATIDLRTRTISRTIYVAPGPIEVLTHRFRTVSVLSGAGATVTDFDVITGQEGKTVAVGAQPVAMTESETTKTLWIANRGDNTVTLIDYELSKAVTIRVGRGPAAISALGIDNVIVANHDDHTITTILLNKSVI